jgi:transposase
MSKQYFKVKVTKPYTEEFQKQIVELRQQGRSCRELCKEYGLGKNTITDWVKKFTGSEEKQMIKSLQQKVKDLEMEVDILKHLALLTGEKKKR